jgi:hypothetical protein
MRSTVYGVIETLFSLGKTSLGTPTLRDLASVAKLKIICDLLAVVSTLRINIK